MTHTPGPWTMQPGGYVEDDGDRVLGIYAADGASIGACEPWDNAHDNARLISAAPDLLAALERIAGPIVEGPREMQARARAAIAKAVG